MVSYLGPSKPGSVLLRFFGGSSVTMASESNGLAQGIRSGGATGVEA